MKSNEILTTEEMSALLPENEQKTEAERESGKRAKVVPYNFRRPDRLSKEQVRSMYLLHDLFAHSLTTSLPLFLRAISEVNLISVEQQPYGDYLRGLSDPTVIFTIASKSLRGVFAVEVNSSIAFPIIDRMLGGNGAEVKEKRAATELELSILEGFLAICLDNYQEAWKPIVDIETDVIGRETRPQLAQVVSPNEVVAAIVYQVRIGETQGQMSICLPVAMVENIIEEFNPSTYSASKTNAPEATLSLLQTVAKVGLSVSAELGTVSAAVSDLTNLSIGDVLKTNHRVEKPLDIKINGIKKFTGRIAAVDGRMVVQVADKHVEQISQAVA